MIPCTPLLTGILCVTPLVAQAPDDTTRRLRELEKAVADLQAKAPKDPGFSVKLTGRVHLDAVAFDGNKNRLANGTQVRRARLGFKATFEGDWSAKGDLDFAEGDVAFKDLYLAYGGWKQQQIQIGQFKQPVGMDTLTSSNETWFTERAYTAALDPYRRIGVAWSTWRDRWQAKVSLFGQAIDDTNNDGNGDVNGSSHGWGYAGRASFLPWQRSDRELLHLGLAAASRKPDADGDTTGFQPLGGLASTVDLSTRPESGKVSRAKFLNAKVTHVDHLAQIALECAGLWGPLSWQAEYQQMKIYRKPSTDPLLSVDHRVSAWYGQVSWLFGGIRRYDGSEGLFEKVAPGRSGALELVARLSHMNQDDLTPVDPLKGGQARNLSLGLTWYVNRQVRMMLDHVRVDHNENARPKASFGGIPGDDFGITTLRVQFSF